MFDNLTGKLNEVFKKLKGHGKLSESNINDALRDVRMSLLEADVNFRVVKQFIDAVRDRAIGKEVMESLTPGQQFVKVIYDELVRIMGPEGAPLNFAPEGPSLIMLVGLQGSGKTTTAGKLAKLLLSQNKRPLLVPADIKRPAAIDQLKTVGAQVGVQVYDTKTTDTPVSACNKGVDFAKSFGFDTIILDTAGRLHIDDELMAELKEIQDALKPHDTLLVADAMTGQDAVIVARKFNDLLAIDGLILTKLDGDARGGAALSIKAVTGKPIKFVGMGEKLDELEPFYPERMASRILDMGDVLSLVEKAQASMDEKQARDLQRKIRKNSFTLEDFLDQIQQIKKLGSLEQIMAMLPGGAKMKGVKDLQADEKELVRIEAIIKSMTREERRDITILNGSRRLRIAKGSGTTVPDVNRLLKKYMQTKKMIKLFSDKGMKKFGKGMLPF